MRALLEGRFTEAEQLALQALTLGQRLLSQSAEGIFGMQMFMLRKEQGRLHEVAPIVEMFVKEHSGSSFKPGLALMYAELGLTDKARTVFEELAVNEFMGIQQDALWAASITFLVEVCATLGDRDVPKFFIGCYRRTPLTPSSPANGHPLGRVRGSWGSLPPRWA